MPTPVYRGPQQKIRQHPGSQDVVQTEACCLIAFSNLCSVLSPCYCTPDAVISLLRAWGQRVHKQSHLLFFISKQLPKFISCGECLTKINVEFVSKKGQRV